MALSSILRRSCSWAIRSVGFHGGVISTAGLNVCDRKFIDGSSLSFSSLQSFSSVSKDGDLISAIKTQIQCCVDGVEDHHYYKKAPLGFPFEIQDNRGEKTVILKRKYEDEVITVLANAPHFEKNDKVMSIPLVVTVRAPWGRNTEITIDAFYDGIVIDSIAFKDSEDVFAYEMPETGNGPDYQSRWFKYLEDRGIDTSTINFLLPYMSAKSSIEYSRWLNNLQSFVLK